MNAERLLSHYERIADAPNAVARLRRFILDLAVRGKLVPQEAEDEPVEELLKRIAKDKTSRIKAGQVRRMKSLPSVDEKPFQVPEGWSWIRLGDLGLTQTGTTPPKNHPDHYGSDVPFVKPGDLYLTHVDYSGEGLSLSGAEASGRIAPGGSILMVCIGTIGKCQLIDRDCSFNQQINALSLYADTEPRFILRVLQSDFFQDAAWAASARTTIAILNKGNWELLALPLPPLAEQRRIVAKTDELMALCDQLEEARASREEARDRLTAASLARLNSPDLESQQSDARFALNALPAITARPDQIKRLQQSILNLAMRGRLVVHDPHDEPASELFKRIATDKKQQIKKRGIRLSTVPLTVADVDVPADLPQLWKMCPLGEIALVTDPNPSHRYPPYDGGTVPILSTQEFSGRDGWNPATAKLVTEEFFQFQRMQCGFAEGDIVFARKGRLGLPRFLPPLDKFTFSHTVFIIKPLEGVLPSFLLWSLRRTEVINWLTNKMNQNTGVPTLGKDKTERLPIALPPLAEQHRIVAKVHELMTLCDQLENSVANVEVIRGRFLEAVFREALVPAQHILQAAE